MSSITLEKKILSANNWGLLALLHEGLMERFEDAGNAIVEGNYTTLNELINNARDIISELLITFREKDELSTNLRSLYLFTNKLITEGEIKKDSSNFKKAINIINPIYLGFKGLESREDANIVSGLTYGKEELSEYITKSTKTFQG
ncbi:flagellar protein FliS [Tissierella sp. MB52-C2]|uniref:flagellar export chaperone FliS n=1 Tax=Tissierella sp. MB52-C2 TaxID=3070999 RepID=UPI00280B307E|nr:flagellar protein FliS [Tissierella sp. MB52-C2]WMM24554.1 flagellar protein FliS [Tissierella sp. MB52-C2]